MVIKRNDCKRFSTIALLFMDMNSCVLIIFKRSNSTITIILINQSLKNFFSNFVQIFKFDSQNFRKFNFINLGLLNFGSVSNFNIFTQIDLKCQLLALVQDCEIPNQKRCFSYPSNTVPRNYT